MSTNKELLDGQTNAEDFQNRESYSIIEREHVRDTPFTIIKEDKGKWMIAMGDSVVEKTDYEEKDDVIDYIDMKSWKLIVAACYIYSRKINELIKN